MNRAKINFIRKLREYFELLPFSVDGKTLCVGLSGGADSVSLLLGLRDVSQTYGFNVSACHFNHMIRGEEADGDEKFCKELCNKYKIKIYCGRDDVPAHAKTYKLSIEEAARNCRYAFFERVCSKNTVDYCVTAHNMNDDAETLILNLIRGSGSNGASSILPYGEKILRPMLKISRQEIEEYLSELGQVYVTDSTNLSNEYSRNYVRNVILPEMMKLNPSVVEALSRYADSCRNDRTYFENLVSENIDSDLREIPKSIRDRILIKKYKDFSGLSLNRNMIADIEQKLFSGNRVCIPLFDNTEAIIDNGKVVFGTKNDILAIEFNEQILIDGTNELFGERVELDLSRNNRELANINKLYTTAYISFDKIKGALKARNRRVGDKITINGINKSLKKMFIDKKVRKEYRDIIPIIFDEEGIIYVPFIGIADRVKCNNDSNTVYLTTIFNTIEKERWNNAYEK